MLSKMRKEIINTNKIARSFMQNNKPIKTKKELSPLLNSKYIPREIYSYISNRLNVCESVPIIIEKKTIEIRILSNKKIDLVCFQKIIAYLLFIIPYANMHNLVQKSLIVE